MEDDLVERIGYLCLMHGVQQSRDEVRTLADLYEREYRLHRRSVPGSRELLELLRKHVKTGVITNGLVMERQEKIRLCQIGNLIDCLIISEEVGLRKPNKEIFVEALRRANTMPFETVGSQRRLLHILASIFEKHFSENFPVLNFYGFGSIIL